MCIRTLVRQSLWICTIFIYCWHFIPIFLAKSITRGKSSLSTLKNCNIKINIIVLGNKKWRITVEKITYWRIRSFEDFILWVHKYLNSSLVMWNIYLTWYIIHIFYTPFSPFYGYSLQAKDTHHYLFLWWT